MRLAVRWSGLTSEPMEDWAMDWAWRRRSERSEREESTSPRLDWACWRLPE